MHKSFSKVFSKARGFTLIELLVVIAIIGILAAIVLAALGQARGKARDASVEGSMASMRAAMELYANSNNSLYYNFTVHTAIATGGTAGAAGGCNGATNATGLNTGFEDTASNMYGLMNAVVNIVGSGTTNIDCGIAAAGNAWSVAVQLTTQNNGANIYWCTDSTGASRGGTANGTAYSTGLINASGPHTTAGQTVCN